MGGGRSKFNEDEEILSETVSCIPASKRYDVNYLTNLLLASPSQPEQHQAGVLQHEDQTARMALAACEALENVSDSYAYSEEAIAAGCVPALLGLTSPGQQQQQQQQVNSLPPPSDEYTNERPGAQESMALVLALAAAHTLLYMLEDSSAPKLFRDAVLPLVQQQQQQQEGGGEGLLGAKDQGLYQTNTSDSNQKTCNSENGEKLRVHLDKISSLVLQEMV
jgi:hypothetical protein